MRRSIAVLIAAALAAGACLGNFAMAQNLPEDYRRSMGNLRPDNNTAAPAIQGSTPRRMPTNSIPTTVVPTPYYNGYGYPQYYAPYGSGYGYYPSYHGYYPPRYYYSRRYYRGYRYLPPIFIPAETNYGPQAVMRFMGVR